MGSSKVNLLGDGHQPHLARPEALEQSKLLGRVTPEPVHSDHDNGISGRAPGIEQVSDTSTTGALRQKLGTRHPFVADDLNHLGPGRLRPGPDTGRLGVQRHTLGGLFLCRNPCVPDDPHALYCKRSLLRLQFGVVNQARGLAQHGLQGG